MSAANDLNKSILIWLSEQFGSDCHAWRQNSGTAEFQGNQKIYHVKMSTEGIADIMAVIRGRGVAIETKVKDGQRQSQKDFQKAHEAAGGVYMIAKMIENVKLGLKIAGIEPAGGWK